MYKVDIKKWHQFSPETQLKNIASELSRAAHAGVYQKEAQKKQAKAAYERALALIEASLKDPNFKDKDFLYQLRDAVAALYVNKADSSISRLLSTHLLVHK